MPRRPLTLRRILAVALVATLVNAGAAEARLAVYAPRAATAKSASFLVHGVRPASVRAARLRVGHSHRALRLRRVRAGIRRGRVFVINKSNPRYKVRQG